MDHSKIDIAIFIEEVKKRINVTTEEIEHFLELWEWREFKRHEMIHKAGTIPVSRFLYLRVACVNI